MNKKDERIYEVFRTRKGFARTKDIIAAGIHRRDIKRARDEEQIIRVKRGLYRLSEIPLISNQGFIDLARAVPEGVICLLSALSYYELTTFSPSVISMAICRGSRRPKIEYPPVEFYHFSRKQFESGIDEVKIKGHKVRIYSPEKTICDCFRYRNKLGLDIAKEGLSEYLKCKDRNLEKLLEYAEICRVRPLLQTWLNALV
ncbi:MAG: type IV toxin-antitoxin system AbiEi family antitoxin domain-containing protein [Candidatus Latescibacteria bacterium]|nr:type IV toxin-antitoxin system AbiEi family antitoxin domain-containing protein [Candidatus Latescibacterota bacterium]